MITEITKEYTKQARLNSKINNNIYDSFDELLAKIEVFSGLVHEDNSDLNFGIFLYSRDVKEWIKGIELQLKREILAGTLKV